MPDNESDPGLVCLVLAVRNVGLFTTRGRVGSEVSEGDRLTDLARQPLIGSVHFRTLSALLFVVRREGVGDGDTMEPLCCTSIRLLHLSLN